MLHPELVSALAVARRRDLDEQGTRWRFWRPAGQPHPAPVTPVFVQGAT
jgi:hypothetical protein